MVTEPLEGDLHRDSVLTANSGPPAPRERRLVWLLRGSKRASAGIVAGMLLKWQCFDCRCFQGFQIPENAMLPTDEWVASQNQYEGLENEQDSGVSYS